MALYIVMDIAGRVLLSGIADAPSVTLDVDFLPQGMYFLQIGGRVWKLRK